MLSWRSITSWCKLEAVCNLKTELNGRYDSVQSFSFEIPSWQISRKSCTVKKTSGVVFLEIEFRFLFLHVISDPYTYLIHQRNLSRQATVHKEQVISKGTPNPSWKRRNRSDCRPCGKLQLLRWLPTCHCILNPSSHLMKEEISTGWTFIASSSSES